MKKEVQMTIKKAAFLLVILLIAVQWSCNQNPNADQKINSKPLVVQDTTPATNSESDEKYSKEDVYEDEPGDSVLARGNHVIFFMKDGEWANEIGAEEVATNFTEHALDAIEDLKSKGYNASFLIGEAIKIGMENEPTFTVDNPECVMGVVLTKPGSKNRLECGVGSASDFWNYFNEYYKPQL